MCRSDLGITTVVAARNLPLLMTSHRPNPCRWELKVLSPCCMLACAATQGIQLTEERSGADPITTSRCFGITAARLPHQYRCMEHVRSMTRLHWFDKTALMELQAILKKFRRFYACLMPHYPTFMLLFHPGYLISMPLLMPLSGSWPSIFWK